jgi:hypothetical protein
MTYIALAKGRRIVVEAVNETAARQQAQKILKTKSMHAIIIMLPEQPHKGR